jgi:hypothetical protein
MSTNFKENILCRFDLIIKFLYVKSYVKQYNTEYFKDLYKNHILLFNGAKEDNKHCIEDFVISFNNLIDSLKKNGYNGDFPIPIYNNFITNGAHRLSASYFLNIQPSVINSAPENIVYDYKFFYNRNKSALIDENSFDNSIIEMLKINKDIRGMLFFPKFTNYVDCMNKSINLVNKYSKILAIKKISITKKGLSNLIKEIYRGEEWIGGLFPIGINPGGKYNVTVNNNDNDQVVYLIILHTKNDIVQIKKNIRNIFNNHHCVHTTDYFSDTFRLISSLLNKNSLHFLNNSNLTIKNKFLPEYFKYLENEEDSDEYCLTSSIVMELYGIRKSKDIDYLQISNKNNFNNQNITPHNNIWLSYYNLDKSDIIFNPSNYFYFNGVKVATLDVIKNMKEKRKEQKDIVDINLIRPFLLVT